MLSLSRSKYFKQILFFSCLLLIFAREPKLFFEPRFWAEEGTEFFQSAFHSNTIDIFLKPLVGYFTLFNSIVSFIAVSLPLEYASTITTYFAFLIQIIPVSIIIFTNHKFWDTRTKKILLSLLITILTPWEIWLTTTNSHILFGLSIFLIAISSNENDSNLRKYFYRVLLVLGTLTGPASSFSTPIFLFRLYREKKKEILIQTILISVSALLQASAVIYSALFNNKYRRFSNFDGLQFFEIFIRDGFALLLPFENTILIIVGLLNLIYILYILSYKFRKFEYQYLLVGFIIISLLSILGSLKMHGSPRYSYIPTIILCIVFMNELTSEKFKNTLRGSLIYTFTGILIIFSITNYNKANLDFVSVRFPNWKNEVKIYKLDNNYKLKIHPYFPKAWEWELDLKPKKDKTGNQK